MGAGANGRDGKDRNAFGRVVKRHREAQGISQGELEQRMHASSGYVSRIESGSRQGTRPAARARIAQGLGVPLEQLEREEREELGLPPEPTPRVDPREAIRQDGRLTPRQRAALVEMYDTMLSPHPGRR